MLIESRRYSHEDARVWRERARIDAIHCRSVAYRRRIDSARSVMAQFAEASSVGYVGVSWGKDSVTVAHMAYELGVPWPLVWCKIVPVDNPDCPLVRDAFLARHPMRYDEIAVPHDPRAKRTSEPGFAEAARRHGDRYVSGLRGQESPTRSMSVATHGVSTARVCRPLARCSAADVFAYLYEHNLPVHPAYACSMGGLLDREHLRVGALGGQRGRGWGREEWEQRYYRDELREVSRT